MKKLLLLCFIAGFQHLKAQGFYDDFSYNNNNWYTVSSTQEFFYTGNQLVIEQVRKKSGFSSGSFVYNNRIDQRKNFKMTCQMRLNTGVIGNGLVWNFIDAENNYRFLITDRDKSYAIYKIENSKATAVKSWGKSDAINKNFSTNTLSIEHRNGRTYFYINDSLVHDEYIDYDYAPKTFGIFLGESTSDGFGKLTVDYFRLDYDGVNSDNNGGGGDSDKAPGKY